MQAQAQPAVTNRNRAILGIRAGTVAAILGSIGLTWLFAILAEDFFSGKAPVIVVPQVPQQAAPVQTAPKVITTVVHKVGYPPGGGGAPRPPSSAPGAAPAPAPPPACHSTPTKPC
jgi:hypothetical protein